MMNVDQVFLQHPFVTDFRPAHWTRVLRILAAFFFLVPNQRLHPSVLLATIRTEVSPKSLVIV